MASPYIDCDCFIQQIKACPEIWMRKHPDRKNKFRVAKQWESIRKKFPEFTLDELKKRWKNLKDTYRKELKRLPQSRPGVPCDNFKSNWRYYESLRFLREELFLGTKEQEDTNPSQPEPIEASNQSPASPDSSKSEDETPLTASSSKRRNPKELRAEFLQIERKKMKILEEEIARSNDYMKSDNYHFLMSLLPEMDKLPPLQKMRLRTKISQAVLDEVSLAMYDDQQNLGEVQEIQQMHFQENSTDDSTVVIIKEEAINMYD